MTALEFPTTPGSLIRATAGNRLDLPPRLMFLTRLDDGLTGWVPADDGEATYQERELALNAVIHDAAQDAGRWQFAAGSWVEAINSAGTAAGGRIEAGSVYRVRALDQAGYPILDDVDLPGCGVGWLPRHFMAADAPEVTS